MQPNVNASESTNNAGASIRLNVEHFDLVTNMLGHKTWAAKATFIGMDASAVSRAREGGRVSARFIAGTRLALDPYRDWFAEKNTEVTDESLFTAVSGAALAERVA